MFERLKTDEVLLDGMLDSCVLHCQGYTVGGSELARQVKKLDAWLYFDIGLVTIQDRRHLAIVEVDVGRGTVLEFDWRCCLALV